MADETKTPGKFNREKIHQLLNAIEIIIADQSCRDPFHNPFNKGTEEERKLWDEVANQVDLPNGEEAFKRYRAMANLIRANYGKSQHYATRRFLEIAGEFLVDKDGNLISRRKKRSSIQKIDGNCSKCLKSEPKVAEWASASQQKRKSEEIGHCSMESKVTEKKSKSNGTSVQDEKQKLMEELTNMLQSIISQRPTNFTPNSGSTPIAKEKVEADQVELPGCSGSLPINVIPKCETKIMEPGKCLKLDFRKEFNDLSEKIHAALDSINSEHNLRFFDQLRQIEQVKESFHDKFQELQKSVHDISKEVAALKVRQESMNQSTISKSVNESSSFEKTEIICVDSDDD